MRQFFLLMVVLIGSFSSFAQTEPKFRKLDSLLNHFTENNRFMGAVSIREKDKIVFEKAYGFADVENGIKATNATKYKIGSVTKMFTAAIVFQLIEEKKLTLDTRLSKFYPEIKNADKITIKNLLNHKSGIYNYTEDTVFTKNMQVRHAKKDMLKMLSSYNPVFEPETASAYSNSNYLLLGYIIEDVTGKPYKANLTERITNKTGLKDTYYYSKINPKKREAFSYQFDGGAWQKQEEWHESGAFAAGAIQSTANDLTKFIKALFDGRIIKKTSLDEMIKLDQGMGHGIIGFPFGERRFLGHNGKIESFNSTLAYYPSEGMSISILSNGDNYDLNDIAIGVLSIYYKLPYRFPNLKIVQVPEEILKTYDGVYSSKQIPLKITVRNNNGKLTAQATGQDSFPLTAVSETEFVFDPAGVIMVFRKEGFTLKQGGMDFDFIRE